MRRPARLAPLLAALLLPGAAAAQTWSYLGRAEGYPAGIAVPGAGVASAEEPAALAVNPAAAGLHEGLTLQYFHERDESQLGPAGQDGLTGDGVYAGLGPVAITAEWMRPRSGPSWRRIGLGLGLGGRLGAVGTSWNTWASDDPGIGQLRTWDVGATLRPVRWLSVGAAVLDLDGRLRGAWLPVRYHLGVATRLFDDAVTLSADWLADRSGGAAFRSRGLAFGAAWETPFGIALGGQLQVPIGGGADALSGNTLFLLTLAVNARHAGFTAGAGGTGHEAENASLLGARISSRAYRGVGLPPRPVLVDVAAELDPPRSLLFRAPPDPLGDLLRKLRGLRDDAEVGPVVLKLDRLALAPGHADELRAAILDLRAHRPVVAWLHGGGLREVYLATAATRVEMLPPAMLAFTGIGATSFYLKDALAKAGIAFQAVAIGRYKNAPDTLGRSDMSEAEREVREAVLDDVFGREVAAIAAARKLDEPRVRALVDEGLFTAEAAKQAGLVDGLSWPDELERTLRAPGGLRRDWSAPEPRAAQRWGPRPAVAVIPVAGAIVPGRSRGGALEGRMAGADTVADLVRRAADDASVKAIVLRVDSPGGDALASDLIWRSLVAAKRRKKPVVVSMGDVAASGGYWVATAGDAIVAEPSTLTGSIGVFAQKPDLSGLLGKLDARAVTLKRGAKADLESPFRPWTEEEQAAIRKEIGVIYDTFLQRVSAARRLSKEEVDKVAQGRVWTGQQAFERRLVDRLGGLADAVALARERAGIPPDEEVEVRRLQRGGALWEEIDPGLPESPVGALVRILARSPELRAVEAMLEMGTVVALPEGWLGPVTDGTPSPP